MSLWCHNTDSSFFYLQTPVSLLFSMIQLQLAKHWIKLIIICHLIKKIFKYQVCVTFEGNTAPPLDLGSCIRLSLSWRWRTRRPTRTPAPAILQRRHFYISIEKGCGTNCWYREVEERVLLLKPFEVLFGQVPSVNYLLLSRRLVFHGDGEGAHGGACIGIGTHQQCFVRLEKMDL